MCVNVCVGLCVCACRVCVLCEQTYLPGNHYCTDLKLFEELKRKSMSHFYFYFCL